MTVVDIATYNLNNDDTGAVGGSYIEIIPITTVDATQWRFTLMASSAGWSAPHVGLGICNPKYGIGVASRIPIIELKCGGAFGFNRSANEVFPLDDVDLTALGITLEEGDCFQLRIPTSGGAPKNNLITGLGEYFAKPDTTSWNVQSPTNTGTGPGNYTYNMSYIGGVTKVTALNYSPPAPYVWAGGARGKVRLFGTDAEGVYTQEKPDGSTIDTTGYASGLHAALDFAKNHGCAMHAVGMIGWPYDCPPLKIGTLNGHDIIFENLVIKPSAPITQDFITFDGFDRCPRFSWESGSLQVHIDANYPTALGVAFQPFGYRILYPDGTADGSPFYPGRIKLASVEAIRLPGFPTPAGDALVGWRMDKTTGVMNSCEIDIANVDCGKGYVQRVAKAWDAPWSSFAYNRIRFNRGSMFTNIGLEIGSGSANSYDSGNSWAGYFETGNQYGGSFFAGIKSSATFDRYTDIIAINCFSGQLQHGIYFTSAAQKCLLPLRRNGECAIEFNGCLHTVTDNNGSNY